MAGKRMRKSGRLIAAALVIGFFGAIGFHAGSVVFKSLALYLKVML